MRYEEHSMWRAHDEFIIYAMMQFHDGPFGVFSALYHNTL